MSKARVRTHTNPFNFYQKLEPLKLNTIFDNPTQPLDLEIGFGKGVFLQHWAKLNPEHNVVGVEVRKGIVEIVKEEVNEKKVKNIHLIHNSGERVLEDCISDNQLNSIFIFHPDPWLKKSHHKRRIIREDVLNLIEKKLKPGGKLYLSTDVDSLWEAMLEALNKSTLMPVKDYHFWESTYTSHWDKFSKIDQRSRNHGTWEKQV